jgi:hypothetical protein
MRANTAFVAFACRKYYALSSLEVLCFFFSYGTDHIRKKKLLIFRKVGWVVTISFKFIRESPHSRPRVKIDCQLLVDFLQNQQTAAFSVSHFRGFLPPNARKRDFLAYDLSIIVFPLAQYSLRGSSNSSSGGGCLLHNGGGTAQQLQLLPPPPSVPSSGRTLTSSTSCYSTLCAASHRKKDINRVKFRVHPPNRFLEQALTHESAVIT